VGYTALIEIQTTKSQIYSLEPMPEGLKQEAQRMGIKVVNEKEGIILAGKREFESDYCTQQKAIAISEQLEIIKSLTDKEIPYKTLKSRQHLQ
jgi:hypothetical protein